MSEDRQGPSFHQLLKLRDALPGMVKAMRRRAQGKGVKGTPTRREPRKYCTLCTAVFDYELVTGNDHHPIEEGVCEKCQDKIQSGYVGVKDAEGRAMWVKDADIRAALNQVETEEGSEKIQIIELGTIDFQRILDAHKGEEVKLFAPPDAPEQHDGPQTPTPNPSSN